VFTPPRMSPHHIPQRNDRGRPAAIAGDIARLPDHRSDVISKTAIARGYRAGLANRLAISCAAARALAPDLGSARQREALLYKDDADRAEWSRPAPARRRGQGTTPAPNG